MLRGLPRFWAYVMLFVYLDDFGHVGPYVSKSHPKFNTSPIFGFAGLALPEHQVRPFSSFFLQLKQHTCKEDIEKAGRPAFRWEKKGNNLFTRKSIVKYQSVREAGFRLLSEIRQRGGFVFYYGREKVFGEEPLSPIGLQTTALGHALRRLDTASAERSTRFALVLDQSSAKLELLECAQKSMFGTRPLKQLACPPFEVESFLDQNMQAADWISSLVSKIWAYRIDRASFEDCEMFDTYFASRLQAASHRSRLERRADLPRSSRRRVLQTTTTVVQTEEVIEVDTSD